MTAEELLELIRKVQKQKCETAGLEIKSACSGCPKHLYDTLSAFSNQDDGGVILFGVDEEAGFEAVGVYDPQDLQKKINEQCLQMEPPVRPLLSAAEEGGRVFVSAEIPGIDMAQRPCYYKGRGRMKGSYVRVGDSDEPMTDYEIYSYEAFRKKYQDDVRPVPRAARSALDRETLNDYLHRVRRGKPNLSQLEDEAILNLMSIVREERVTLSAVMMFGLYPQAYFPQLCITAVAVPGTQIGMLGEAGERFTDNMRIEGNIPYMLEESIRFVVKNMRKKTIINPQTGAREDRTDYPVAAVREALINALLHRDYSIHTEGMPVQIILYEDRLEVRSPGGLYGRMRLDQLGKVQPDTRNPVLASLMETMEVAENRYSGIPTMQRAMAEYQLEPVEFTEERGTFVARFYHRARQAAAKSELSREEKKLVEFCQTPRTRGELVDFLGLSSAAYAIQRHVMPLVEAGYIHMSMPDKPKSPKQRFCSRQET